MTEPIKPGTVEQKIGRHTILAVDDSALILEALEALFSSSYQMIHSSNGAAALELARALRPDLIITDVMLAALDGIELLREVRRDPRIGITPVIVWSMIYRPHQIKALASGCDPFVALEKLGDLDLLLFTVSDLVASQASRNLSLLSARRE